MIVVGGVRAYSLPQSQSSATILGRVVDATSGQPVAGTIVKLEPAGKQAPIVTGSDGQFLFRQLSPGLYRITASKPGYLNSAYGQMRARGQETMLLLAENARRDDIAIRMWPWATIAGRVIDEHGRPVVGIGVQAWRRAANGRLDDADILRFSVNWMFTDTDGRFAIPRLAPGQYVVGIRCGSFGGPSGETVNVIGAPGTEPHLRGASLPDRGGTTFTWTTCNMGRLPAGNRARMYVSTFYGDVASLASGSTIVVGPGETVFGIDLTLRSQVTSRIAGTVTGFSGPVPSGAVIRLLPADWGAMDVLHQVNLQPDGSFAFVAVTPGSYAIRAASDGGFWIDQPISVQNDIDDLIVTVRPGVKITGEIRTEGTGSAPSYFEVTLNTRRRIVQVEASGAFVITDVTPGTSQFSPKSTNSDWQIVSAILGGREVLGTMIDIGPKDVSGLVLHFSDRPASIGGNVIDPRGTSSPDASVVLFPADPRLWTSARDDSPLFRSVRTWSGHYVFERLPVGEYVLAAVDDTALDEWPDATLLSRIAAVGQRIRITTDQAIERDLRVEFGIR